MVKLQRRYAPFIFGIIQATITTGIATAIATPFHANAVWDFFAQWVSAWALAWAAMLPLVIFLAPLIWRAVNAVTIPDPVAAAPAAS